MKVDNSKYLNFTQQPDFQKILTNPILDIAARFWEDNRYAAFRTCYRSMRIIDDLVDDRKERGCDIPDDEKAELTEAINHWLTRFENQDTSEPFLSELISTANDFRIPIWPWKRLAKAMIYDLNHNGFRNFATFLRYAEGAAIAPASIFMHLCGVRSTDGNYRPPDYDIRMSARSLAVFSYLVHIMRDFQKDQLAGLNYFADTLLAKHYLDSEQLKKVAGGGDIPAEFRKLMRRYVSFTAYYQARAKRVIAKIKPSLMPQYQLSLEMIYQLYSQIFERIDWREGDFSAGELNPTPQEIQDRIYQTVTTFVPVK
jgi:phytoene synthase